MSISIHELLAVARESEGVKAVQGDAMLCEKRFAPYTRHMVELQKQGILRFQRQALVLEGTLHYLPVQTFFRDQE